MSARWQWRHAVPVAGHTMTSPMREVHDRLVRLGSEPVYDPDAAWQDLRRMLPARPLSWSGRLMAWLRRPAIAIMTTGLLGTGVAHAAGVQPVRSGLDWMIGGVSSIVGAGGEARDEPGARHEARRRASDGAAGPSEENRRRSLGGVGLGLERDPNEAPAGRGRPASVGAGAGDDEDRDESRDHERDDERDDDERDDDERDDDERDDDEGRSEPDDEEAEEPDDEEAEETDDEPREAQRDANTDVRDDLEGDAHEEADPEEDED